MFGTILCNARHSFLSFSHLIFDFIHKFCCVTAHDEFLKINLFLAMQHGFPRPNVNQLSVPCRLRISAEKKFLTMKSQLFAVYPKKFPQVSTIDRALQLHSSTIEKTKIDHNPLAYNLVLTVPLDSPFYRHLEQISQDLDINTKSPRVWWNWRRHDRRRSCGQIHHGSRFV